VALRVGLTSFRVVGRDDGENGRDSGRYWPRAWRPTRRAVILATPAERAFRFAVWTPGVKRNLPFFEPWLETGRIDEA